MTDDAADDVDVVEVPEAGRFVVRIGGQPVGFTEYRPGPAGERVFFHTEVDPSFEGRGLASRLISAALDATRAAGLLVVAECPFVRAYVRRHPEEYRDLVVRPRL